MRLAGHWLGTVASVRRSHVGSGEPLILSQGARACFMAVEQCTKRMNRAEVDKKDFRSESKIWAFHTHPSVNGWLLNGEELG